jgi:hypothetical protein
MSTVVVIEVVESPVEFARCRLHTLLSSEELLENLFLAIVQGWGSHQAAVGLVNPDFVVPFLLRTPKLCQGVSHSEVQKE